MAMGYNSDAACHNGGGARNGWNQWVRSAAYLSSSTVRGDG
jgi:hypothetical protein